MAEFKIDYFFPRIMIFYSDPLLWVGIILITLQRTFQAQLDPLVQLGILIGHHLVELPAFLIIGVWLHRCFKDEPKWLRHGLISLLTLAWIIGWSRLDYYRTLETLVLLYPFPLGFYLHMIYVDMNK